MGELLLKPEDSPEQREAQTGMRALLARHRGQRGQLIRLSDPQNNCCLRGWSVRSTPGCLGRERRLEPCGEAGDEDN